MSSAGKSSSECSPPVSAWPPNGTWPPRATPRPAPTAFSIAYSDIEDGDSNGVNGCISADPQFMRDGSYRIQKGSPCWNTGRSLPWMIGAQDLLERPRVASGFVDMGAYETPAFGTLFVVR